MGAVDLARWQRPLPYGARVACGVIAAIVCLSGCGSGRGAKSGDTSTPTKGPDVSSIAYARTINLRAADVRGMVPGSSERAATSDGLTRALEKCDGAVPELEVGGVRSPVFYVSGVSETVMSAVRVASSRARAQQATTADRSAPVRKCIARAFETADPREELMTRRSTVSLLRYPDRWRTGQGRFRLRLTTVNSRLPLSKTGHPSTVIVVQDILGFVIGRAEIVLVDTHEPQHSSTANERRLLSLLYRRGNAATGS
jgi:hypothetical protein